MALKFGESVTPDAHTGCNIDRLGLRRICLRTPADLLVFKPDWAYLNEVAGLVMSYILSSSTLQHPLCGVAVEFGAVGEVELDLQLLAISIDRMDAQVELPGDGAGRVALADER
jgi:hypothetical protein